ncbi:MAG: glycerol-3-phosphate acyltransferase [Armatimonadetes bacterium]|nr:glycerol-3-phosphate acyltransferase [Armatimonadota bacterium]
MPEGLRAPALVLVAYLLGSIPFGYLLVRLARGIDIRDYGSLNIGATNVLRVVGPIPALITLLGDILKGLVPVWLAGLTSVVGPRVQPGWVVATGLAAILGHAYSFYFYVQERRFARGKAIATGLGVLIGLVAGGEIPWPGVAIPAAVWGLTLALPRLLSGQWGFVSLSSILAAASVPVTLALADAAGAYVTFTALVALFVLWKHKENVGRLLDGVELRLGERLPITGLDRDEVACAFLIHAITPADWWQTRRFSWARGLYERGLLPLSFLARLVTLVRPMKVDVMDGIVLRDGRRVRVYLIAVPWLPEQIKRMPALAVRRAVQAARLARRLGVRVMGLGAYWSVVGAKGEVVQAQSPGMAITNGGAYTAGTVRLAIPLALARLEERGLSPEQARVAVVGANGVVGFGVCRQLAGRVGTLVMVGTTPARLERSAEMLRRRYRTHVETTTALVECRTCDLIFTATSQPDPVLYPEHIRPTTVIYDLGRPMDAHPDVLRVPGVRVIPGGVVRPPGELHGRVDVHFGSGAIPACMAETILIAADEAYDRCSVGERTLSENIDYFVRRGEELGFTLVEEWEPAREPVRIAS